jgi:hypothetical protein
VIWSVIEALIALIQIGYFNNNNNNNNDKEERIENFF